MQVMGLGHRLVQFWVVFLSFFFHVFFFFLSFFSFLFLSFFFFFFSSATLVAQTTSIYSWKTPFILFLSLGILPSLTQGVFVFFFCFTSLFIGKNKGSRTLLGGMIMVISLFRLEHVYFCISKAFLKKIELNFFSLL